MKTVLGCIRRADQDFDMIAPGDHIAVGVSGGKDSLLLLRALSLYRLFSKKDFTMEALMLTMGLEPFDTAGVVALCEEIGVPLTIKKTDIGKIIFEERHEKNPCALCAKMRRGALNELAAAHGANKLALGHHREDVLETLLMSLFYEGRLHTFHPVTYLSRTGITVIRPMVYLPEKHILHMKRALSLPVIDNPCPANGHTARQEAKELIASLSTRHKNLQVLMLSALQNKAQYGLWDQKRSGEPDIAKSGAQLSPITKMLNSAQGTVRLHMPGHKGLVNAYDMTELSRTDDLYAPSGAIVKAEALAAKSCGAGATILLTGGSTAGITAMLLSHVAPGGKLILSRNAHNAALSGCVLGGIDAVFADDPLAAIEQNPDAQAVLVTRPDYYGNCVDLLPIAEAAHARSMALLVDEAHGAHFPWWDAPQSAGKLSADAWVQSAHKTLPALGGAAFLHSARTDASRMRRFLRMVQTSSPSFVILESLDAARAYMDAQGREALSRLCSMLLDFRGKLEAIPGLSCVHSDDPTRLVILTRGRGLTGINAQRLLSRQRIDVEMADDDVIVCITTVFDTWQTFARLLTALERLPQSAPLPPSNRPILPQGPQLLSLREASLSAHEAVPLEDAAGRIAAVSAGLYPPGVPLLLPGEQIGPDIIAALASLPENRRFGIENGALIVVK